MTMSSHVLSEETCSLLFSKSIPNIPPVLRNGSMTFWSLCPWGLKLYRLILWFVFTTGEHPENPACCTCGFTVRWALRKWQCAFFVCRWCSQLTVPYCFAAHDIVISSLQSEYNLLKDWKFFDP